MARAPREDGATAVYWLYSRSKKLLYVGVSHHPKARWREHARDKAWWPEVAHKGLSWHPTRAQAVLEEQRVIEEEGPQYNLRLTPEGVPAVPGVGASRDAYIAHWRRSRAYTGSHKELRDAVLAELDKGTDIDLIARSVDWSREYIARLRSEGSKPPRGEGR